MSRAPEDPQPAYKIIPASPEDPPPEIKRYAHHGKRRRSYTDELLRCSFVTKVMSDDLVCNALLWKNKPDELKEHLKQHMLDSKVNAMSPDQVLAEYQEARRIFLEHIPDDKLYGLGEEDLDEDEDPIDIDLDEIEEIED